MQTDPRIDAYIDKQAEFARPILTWLRARMHAACPDVEETIKWSHPFFTRGGRPLANMAGFKAHAGFGFWDRSETTGKEGEAMGQLGRIASLDDLPGAAEVEALVKAAVARMDAGVKPPRAVKPPKSEIEVPPELAEALAGDAAASATFDGFPPSCRREYCEWIGEAKRPETRAARVAQAVEWMAEGKVRNWKYQK